MEGKTAVRAPHAPLSARLLATALLLALSGCYESLDVSSVSCRVGAERNCPADYECRAPVGASFGRCCMLGDLTCGVVDAGGPSDVPLSVDADARDASLTGEVGGKGTGGSGAMGGAMGGGGAVATGGAGGRGGAGGTSVATGGVQGLAGAQGTGGVQWTAGMLGTGGVQGSGGMRGTGGRWGTGGAAGTGGMQGGAQGTGGVRGTGGMPGTPGTGGAPGTGGLQGMGGRQGTGGSGQGGVAWGKKENPTASCSVGAMPDFASLPANPKLPDPFAKMDGTRITDKSQWACRREEILRQGFKFIYGDKPIPVDVSGTVSTSSISVRVTDGAKSTTFAATVSMNGAPAPAPAIITYAASGAPVPSGVAKINFTPTETTGPSGAKSGPFFDIYGSNHAAGYMVSNAWVVSRIIDVLEQNPGVIDPYRVGVTGCSRWGKGAFVAGVLDNRVALTIPVESGIAGTVALRLVEQLDPSGEWPYHAISYVRWLSEVALGPFTTGGSAAADNTDKLPVDMHELMALIVPRGLYIVDNPHSNYAGLNRNSAWVTANAGKVTFQALGYGDNLAYEGASGAHCGWRSRYDESLNAMVDKFLKGNASATTGRVATDLPDPKPDPAAYLGFTIPTLSGQL